MPYDDGSSLHEMEAILDSIVQVSGQLSVSRAAALAMALHKMVAGRDLNSFTVNTLAEGLSTKNLSAVPFESVLHVAKIVSKVSPNEDVLRHVTLRDLAAISDHSRHA